MDSSNLKKYTISQLKDFCKQMGIKGVSTLNKTALIDVLQKNNIEVRPPEKDEDACPHCGRPY